MCTKRVHSDRKTYNKGFTLIEIITVIAILTILVSIAVPSFVGYVEKAKKEVCNVNRLQVERRYQADLTEIAFEQYLLEYANDTCPSNGVISNVDGRIQCSVHGREDDVDSGDGEVPYL